MIGSIIEAKNLTLSYDGIENVIDNATISVKSNEFVFVTGKSGSGKSTFIKALYGALTPIDGYLSVCGISLNSIKAKRLNFLRRHIGIIFQDYRLIKEWSVERNVMLPLLVSGFSKQVCYEQTQKLLKHVKLVHKAHKYPLELSGGEQQRVAVARAMAHNPILLLADEPTGNLDDYSSELVWELLKGARNHLKATVLVVTHKIPATINTDYRHYFLDSGKLHEVI